MTRLIAIAIACALTACLLLGCGSPETIAKGTPKATAKAFVAAMASGNYDAIAAGWEYEAPARRSNPDWESFPPGQRKLIIDQLQENKATEVAALSGMMAGDVSVGEATEQDQRAVVALTAGPITMRMVMLEVDGVWKVLQVAEQAAQQ